ncbi:MAG: hypothetical protein [CRESS virus sp. ctczB4]|uniref:Uncharacterized protein n=1 Tax=CRESS virus sp. ctczB4 TaxID=2656682 RepID=A0A5Q2W3A7_9VIRU|nr:MAG: hypothetical protein [CRESS virus sp. ctczB4]
MIEGSQQGKVLQAMLLLTRRIQLLIVLFLLEVLYINKSHSSKTGRTISRENELRS